MLMTSLLEDYERLLRMSTALGFEVVGRWPKRYWKPGRLRDEILLG
jgi:hypothetical protein